MLYFSNIHIAWPGIARAVGQLISACANCIYNQGNILALYQSSIFWRVKMRVILKSKTCSEDDVHPSFVYYKPQWILIFSRSWTIRLWYWGLKIWQPRILAWTGSKPALFRNTAQSRTSERFHCTGRRNLVKWSSAIHIPLPQATAFWLLANLVPADCDAVHHLIWSMYISLHWKWNLTLLKEWGPLWKRINNSRIHPMRCSCCMEVTTSIDGKPTQSQ